MNVCFSRNCSTALKQLREVTHYRMMRPVRIIFFVLSAPAQTSAVKIPPTTTIRASDTSVPQAGGEESQTASLDITQVVSESVPDLDQTATPAASQVEPLLTEDASISGEGVLKHDPVQTAPTESAIAEALASIDELEAEQVEDASVAERPSQPTSVSQVGQSTIADATSSDSVASQTVAPVSPVNMSAQMSATPPSASVIPTGDVQSSSDPASTTSAQAVTNLLDALVVAQELEKSMADKIMVDHISTGQSIEELLTKENVVSELALTKAKSTLNNVGMIDLAQVGIYPEALNRLPEGVARSYKMLPFELNKEEGTLSVAMMNPLDLSAIDFAQQKTGLRIQAFYALPSELERLLAEYYSQSLSTEVTEAIEQATQTGTSSSKKVDYSSLSKQTIRQAPISKIVDTVLTFAIKARASDVHIEPLEERTRVRYRIDGILVEKLILPRSVHDAVVSRIKILAGLKIDEKRVPQDGRFNFVGLDQEVDLRVSTLPTIHGEKIVMRLLKKDQKVPTLPELGLNGIALRNVQDSIKVPHGIVLITGPTGSGKTTTLYSILHVINSPRVNIMTLEDPVEYQMQGVNQVQINPQAGLSFASGLRSFLRQDPNVIMVGEIRDSETAELAIQASLTGHLVFSTLHTSSAAGAIPRLMDMGAEPFLLASSMTLVMAQRVMRLINPDFKEEYKPEPAVLEDIKTVLGDRLESWCRQKGLQPEDIVLTRPAKNRPQTEPEYKGRIAIFEVMKISEAIAQLILSRKPASEMEKVAVKDGMLLMKQDGYIKALEGLTTIEEVLRVAQI